VPTTYLQSRLPSFNAGSKVGPFVLRGTNPANPQTAVYLGVRTSASPFYTYKHEITSTYNSEILLLGSAVTIYHFQTTSTNTCQLLTQGIKAIGDIRINVLPVDGDTIIINCGSVGKTYRFKNTLAAVNDVKIGATIIATASNLAKAIMVSSIAFPPTEYYNGTTVHPIFTAVAYGAVVVLIDKIGCLRVNEYTLTASNETRFSTRTPSGGADGILLAETNGTTITEFRDTETYKVNRKNYTDVATNYNYAPNFSLELKADIPQTKSILTFGGEDDYYYQNLTVEVSYDNVNWIALNTYVGDAIGKQNYYISY